MEERIESFSDYQARAAKTAIYPGQGKIMGLAYIALGLGESGEFQGKVKKIMRDNGGLVTETARQELAKELGDILWYVSNAAKELQIDLETIASQNIAKLESRQSRGVLQGSGDNR